MTVTNQNLSLEAGGDQRTDSNPGGDQSQDIQKQDSVSYQTYKEVLDQRKADQKRLKALEEELGLVKTKEKEIEEKKLRDKGEYQKLLDARDKENAELKSKFSEMEKNLVDGTKLQAFLDKLPGKIKKNEFLMFVDLEKIPFNPETKKVDESGLSMVVNEFVRDYSDLIQTSSKKILPGDAPNPVSTLTYDQWLKLPLDEKKKRQKDVK